MPAMNRSTASRSSRYRGGFLSRVTGSEIESRESAGARDQQPKEIGNRRSNPGHPEGVHPRLFPSRPGSGNLARGWIGIPRALSVVERQTDSRSLEFRKHGRERRAAPKSASSPGREDDANASRAGAGAPK